MNISYFSVEVMGALTILILLYANVFELKQHSRKRNIFTALLLGNLLVVTADALSWLPIDWNKLTAPLFWLIAITYVAPVIVQAIFTNYLYAHISEKAEVRHLPFQIMLYYSAAIGILSLVLCLSGKMFEIRDGKYLPGPLESLYYLFYIIALLYLLGIILANSKQLGLHDLIAAASFCMVPLASIVVTISGMDIALAVPFMPVDMLLIFITLQAERENTLFFQSNTDELTGLLNRRAYEEDLVNYPEIPPQEDFVYASIDVNGLKQVNDTLGHAAGDELISGAAQCLKRTLGNYGRVYRTGGDEFISVFFADENRLPFLLADFEAAIHEWSGKLVDRLSVSIGYVSKKECPNNTVSQLARIADNRMYQAKDQHYASKGIDRKGQHEAHKVLCSLYTKILKINLTNDTFSVVNMDQDEQSQDKGYSEKISEWLECFGKSGYVHSDDLEEYLAKTNIDYLRGYFRRKKTSLSILYRRKYSAGFKQVLMEIIPARDYRDDNQSLFLYVKQIDI